MMAIPMRVKEEEFEYTDYITELDKFVILSAKENFVSLQAKGIIKNRSFHDDIWYMSNEVKTCSISFQFGQDEIRFERLCKEKLDISLRQYKLTAKVFVVTNMGAEISKLQSIACGCKQLLRYVAGDIRIDDIKRYAGYLSDFIDLLPSSTSYWEQLVDEVESIELSTDASGQRTLGAFQSYFRFDKILSDFWASADAELKTLYFPVWLWWTLTAILPLRPTEFVLIPRNCLKTSNDDYYLTIRRTRLKGEKLSAEYTIAKDYEQHTYQILESIAHEIQNYIVKTEAQKKSDINTLLSQNYQYQALRLVKSNNSRHYTYANLRSCLKSFYETVIQAKAKVVEKNRNFGGQALAEGEIERINLGDTRHIAMISLIVSGGNPVICKELAGHTNIDISSNYYSNLKTFVEAMTFERHLNSVLTVAVAPSSASALAPNAPQLAGGGHCSSSGVAAGNYSDCVSAMSAEGHLMECRYCRYYAAPIGRKIKVDIGGTLFSKAEADDSIMKDSFDNLLYFIDLVRKGAGMNGDIQSAFLKLQATANQYAITMDRAYKEAMSFERKE